MTVLDTGYSSTDSIVLHSHPGTDLYEFHYFLDGYGTFWNSGRVLPIEPGVLFLSGPDDAHGARLNPGSQRFRMYYLQFTSAADPDHLVSALVSRFPVDSPLKVGRAHAAAFEEIRRRRVSAEPLVRRSADYRFLTLACDLAGADAAPTTTGVRYIEEALNLMQRSVHAPMDLETLAGKLGIDKSYFVRFFKKHVGQSPMRYYLGLRLDSAKHRLRNSDEGLRAIALDLGFHDEFHFSHQFKTHVGQSPVAFRQSRRAP